MPWIYCFTCCCRLYLVYRSLCSSVVLLFGILWRTNEPLFPLPFKNDTTMKVLLLGCTLIFRASQGGFIYVRIRVLEPVGERPISHICKKMQQNFNWGVVLDLRVFKCKGTKVQNSLVNRGNCSPVRHWTCFTRGDLLHVLQREGLFQIFSCKHHI